MMKFRGAFVALITPFKNGKVDLKALRRLCEFHISSGTTGLVPCGTTGESPTLSHQEHENVIRCVVDTVDGRIPVIAGAGSNSTDEAVSLSRFAKKVGADAVLSVVPYYNKPTQHGMYQHFEMIAKKVDIPVVLYNIPGRCGAGLSPVTVEKLSRIESIVAIKEATGSMDQASEIASLCDIAILSGDDSLTLPLMSLGGQGVISVAANAFPRDVARMIEVFFDGHIGLAQAIHKTLFPLCRAMFLETNPIPIKTAMKILKLDSGELRLPLSQMSESNKAKLRTAIQVYRQNRKRVL